jgi:type VI secretion system protein ImpF
MARPDPNTPLLPSVFDRLLGDKPTTDGGTPQAAQLWWSRDRLRKSVLRDLDALLNTRRRCLSWPDHLGQLDRSLVNFGVSDFSSANLGSQVQKEQLRADIEQTIRIFEPRFKSVRVGLTETDGDARTLCFRIEVTMYADPVPVHLLFDSRLEPGSRRFSVK